MNMKRLPLALFFVCCTLVIAAQEVTENRGFKAVMNGKYAVEVFFQTAHNDGDWQTAGYIYYPKALSLMRTMCSTGVLWSTSLMER